MVVYNFRPLQLIEGSCHSVWVISSLCEVSAVNTWVVEGSSAEAFPQNIFGTFWEGRLLHLVDGRANKPAEILQGCCSELCPSLMENQIC